MPRLPVPIVRILLILLVLTTPALAHDGVRDAAVAREAAQAFKIYIDEVTQEGGRPDLKRPAVVSMLGRIFDLDALNALPPAQASDISWLLEWGDAANATSKLFTRYGSKPGPRPDLEALQRNMTEYADEFATAMNFMIRAMAREAVAARLFRATLRPEDLTRVREQGFTGLRHSTAEFVLTAICSVIESGGRPENARLVAAAIRDTREVWANFFFAEDRSRVIEYIAEHDKRIPDETARTDLAAFTAALQAVD